MEPQPLVARRVLKKKVSGKGVRLQVVVRQALPHDKGHGPVVEHATIVSPDPQLSRKGLGGPAGDTRRRGRIDSPPSPA